MQEVISQNNPTNEPPELAHESRIPTGLPRGALVQQIVYTSQPAIDGEVLLEFPHPIQRRAVLVKENTDPQHGAGDLLVLTIPTGHNEDTKQEESALLATMRQWVDAETPSNSPPSLMMTLQVLASFGTRGVWQFSRRRIGWIPFARR